MTPIAFLFLAACSSSSPEKAATPESTEPRSFTVLYQGNVIGEIEPCG